MNENNTNQNQQPFSQTGQNIPQSGQPYPQSGFPQSGYPQSGFPQSGQPYPQSGQPYPASGEYTIQYESKTKTWHVAIIAVIAVLIVSLATALILVLHNRNQQQGMMPPPPPPGQMMNVEPGSVMLNGQKVTFDVVKDDGKTYLPVEEFTKAVNGYEYVEDGNTIKIMAPNEISILEIDSTTVSLEDQTAGAKTSVEITKAPFKVDDIVYIYARDLALFLKNTTVNYNPQMDIVEINVGMGGSGMPAPPPGGMPQDGQSQGQAPQGEISQGEQPQGDQSGVQQPQGQPPQNGQPPM